MWRACRVLRSSSSFLAERYKAQIRDGVIQAPFPTAIVDKTTQLYGSIDTIQRKFRSRELIPSHLFDTTMEQINHVADQYRLFSVATPNEVSGNLLGMDQLFNRKSAEMITRKQHMIGLILNSRELRFPAAASKFSKHMERVTTTSIRVLQTLSKHGCSHYGHTHMIARISPFNPKYTGGPGTCIALGIGSVLVDNDAEGHFLSPAPMYSDAIYFRTSQSYNQNSGILARFVSDIFIIFNIFMEEKIAGTHHDLPSATQKVPAPPEERKPVLTAKRSMEFKRAEAALRAEAREKAWLFLGPRSSARASSSITPPTYAPAPEPEFETTTSATSEIDTTTATSKVDHVEPRNEGPAVSQKAKHKMLADAYEMHEYSFSTLASKSDTETSGDMDYTDEVEAGMDESEAGMDESEAGMDESEAGMDETEEGMYETEAGMDEMSEMDEMDDFDKGHLTVGERVENNELDELDELDSQMDRFAALDELGELVEDLDEFEKQEKKEEKALFKRIKLASLHPDTEHMDGSESIDEDDQLIKSADNTPLSGEAPTSDIPHPDTPQPQPDTPPPQPDTPQPQPFRRATQFNTIEFPAPDLEEETVNLHSSRPYYPPYSHELMDVQLKLTTEQLKELHIAYYDAKSENVLPHISHLLASVITRIKISGILVEQYTDGTLSASIQAAQEVWKTLPFANGSAEVTNEIASFFKHYDIILTPACPAFPPLAGAGYPKKDILLQYNALYYPFRLANCPSILLPVIRSPINGMPISLQIVGRPLSDSLVIQVAHYLESIFGPQYPVPMSLQENNEMDKELLWHPQSSISGAGNPVK